MLIVTVDPRAYLFNGLSPFGTPGLGANVDHTTSSHLSENLCLRLCLAVSFCLCMSLCVCFCLYVYTPPHPPLVCVCVCSPPPPPISVCVCVCVQMSSSDLFLLCNSGSCFYLNTRTRTELHKRFSPGTVAGRYDIPCKWKDRIVQHFTN